MKTEILNAVLAFLALVLPPALAYLGKLLSDYFKQKIGQIKDERVALAAASSFQQITSAAKLAVKSTYQTYVAALKSAAADGKLTAADARQALEIATVHAGEILRTQGVSVAGNVVKIAIEAAIADEKKTAV